MLRRIVNKALDWIASWLPAPRPVGVRFGSYDVTRLDLAVAVLGVAGSAASWWYYGHWGWFLVGLLALVFAWMCDRWVF